MMVSGKDSGKQSSSGLKRQIILLLDEIRGDRSVKRLKGEQFPRLKVLAEQLMKSREQERRRRGQTWTFSVDGDP
jgi:hypothetical protein